MSFFLYISRCGITDSNSSMISTFLLVIILSTLVAIVFCYVHVLKTIHDVKEDNSSIANSEVIAENAEQHNNFERKILNKVLTYILVFIFQYIPFLLSDIFQLLKVSKPFFFKKKFFLKTLIFFFF